MRTHIVRGFAMVAVSAAVVGGVAACGSDNNDSTGSTGSAQATQTAKTPAASTGITQSSIDHMLEYTGGKAGAADSSQTPVKIGFALQMGGTPSFDEMAAGANAATKFVNEELGGINGHPLVLDQCEMQSEEDGQKCGAKFLSEKVPYAIEGLAVVGNASLYKTIGGKIPVNVSNAATGPDVTSKGVYLFNGGSMGVVFGWAKDLERLKPKNVAMVSVGNPGGKFTMESLVKPALDQVGIKYGKVVYHADDATTPDIVSALQAAGVSDSDALVFDPSTPQQCIGLWDGLKQLGKSLPVVTSPVCNAPSAIDHTGGKPEGWRIWANAQNPRVADLPDMEVYNQLMVAYGQSKWKDVGFAPSAMSSVFTFAKFANGIGDVSQINAETIKKAILAFRGPTFASPGPLNCGAPLDPATPGVCGTTGTGSAFVDGKWTNLGEITNEFKPPS
jgi:branched-chain amino acid transport system substrate-binding protein